VEDCGPVGRAATGWAFHAEAKKTGHVLGGMLALVGLLVSTPPLTFASHRSSTEVFGFPPNSAGDAT
jgi:hypothetical protein